MPRRRRGKFLTESEKSRDSNTDTLELPGFYYDKVSKKYFKINKDFKSPKVFSVIKTPVAFFPDVFFRRQLGLLKSPFPQSLFTGLLEKIQCPILPDEQIRVSGAKYSCSMLVASANVNSVYGIWTASHSLGYEQKVVGRCALISKEKGGQIAGQSISSYTLALPRKLYYLSSDYKLMDACAVKVDESCCGLLTCQIRHSFEPNLRQDLLRASISAGMLYLPSTNVVTDWRQCWFNLGDELAFSCAYDHNYQKMAFGMQRGGVVQPMNDMNVESGLYTQKDGLFCITFSSDGHCVLSGSRRGIIYCHDLRDHPAKKYTYKITVNNGVLRHLRALQNNAETICSGDCNCLLRLDLRMRRPVVQYREHLNEYLKIPFTMDEGLGILCSTGSDGCTRLWNINNGHLLKSIPSPLPVNDDSIPSAIFKRFWDERTAMPALILAHKEKAYIYHI